MTKKPPPKTEGFGAPVGVDPHHVCVEIPKGRSEPVRIIEKSGIRAGTDGLPEQIVRVELDRAKWTAISDQVKRVFNERLKREGPRRECAKASRAPEERAAEA